MEWPRPSFGTSLLIVLLWLRPDLRMDDALGTNLEKYRVLEFLVRSKYSVLVEWTILLGVLIGGLIIEYVSLC